VSDYINHDILLRKLSYYWLYKIYVSWLKSYLINRKQKVKLWSCNHREAFCSSWGTIHSNKPQGLILGPLLFLIYITDFLYGFRNCVRFVLYATDTSVLVTANNHTELKLQLHSTLKNISKWFTIVWLSLNTKKTNTVKFSTKYFQKHVVQITHQNKLINSKESTKFFGLETDKHMNWKNVIEEILQKLSCACHTIRSMYHTSSISPLKIICLVYFHLKLKYGTIFWVDSTDSKSVFHTKRR
jgi:hypothetical protein